MTITKTLPKVLITNTVPDDIVAPLQGQAEVIMGPNNGDLMPRAEVLQLAPALTAIINQSELQVDVDILDAAPNLKIVANVAVGYNNLDTDLMASRGVWATNAPDIFIESTADFTMGLLLDVARRISESDRYVRAGQWSGFQPGVWDGILLRNRILGIVGYGRIGQAVAVRARAFGMQVIYHRRQRTDDPAARPLKALLQESDFVSLNTPLTSETHHLMNAERLAYMKKGAYLINMARGPVVAEAALVEALQSGHLAGAGLDVFEEEPKVHPALLSMPNVVLTPHAGGGTDYSRKTSRSLCVKNVLAVLNGETPVTPVNQPRL